MGRKNPQFAKVEIDWYTGEKTSQLSPAERDFYINGLWLQAVKYRRATLPEHLVRVTFLSRLMNISRNSCVKYLSKIDAIGLITKHEDGSVTVHGVKELHGKLKWKEVKRGVHETEMKRTRNGRESAPSGEGGRERGNSGEVFIKPTSGTPDTGESVRGGRPDPEVDRKSGLSGDPERATRTCAGEHESLRKLKAQIPSDPETIRQLAWAVQATLGLGDDHDDQMQDLVSSYPKQWLLEAMQSTREKQQLILEGTAEDFKAGPVEYLTGILEKKRREWREVYEHAG